MSAKFTVQQLIEELEKIEDKTKIVVLGEFENGERINGGYWCAPVIEEGDYFVALQA